MAASGEAAPAELIGVAELRSWPIVSPQAKGGQAAGITRNGLEFGRLLLEGRAFFALIAIVAAFSFLSPNYFTIANFLTMATHVALFGILAVGMLMVILNGGIDLSVGSTLGLSGAWSLAS